MKTVAQEISARLSQIQNLLEAGNTSMMSHCGDKLRLLVKELMPSGWGFDMGTTLHVRSTPNKLVFVTEFHHMNDDGFYDGWTGHIVTVVPTFNGMKIHVSGRNRDSIKDVIAETFSFTLGDEYTPCDSYNTAVNI
jgi:hypothetical protein